MMNEVNFTVRYFKQVLALIDRDQSVMDLLFSSQLNQTNVLIDPDVVWSS